MKYLLGLFLLGLFWLPVQSQGLFESGLKEQDGKKKTGLEISGYTRATGFLGIINQESPTLKSLYNETSLQLKAKTGIWGQAFTDLRFRAGDEYGNRFKNLDIREAYVDLYLNKFNLRIGKQISPWGRADGWNPTDNLTPSDYFVRSPNYDDMRIGNFRIRGQYHPFEWLRLEADIVPLYNPSVYRFDQVGMPAFVTILNPANPEFVWNKSTVAGKLDLIFSGIEGSVSWFKGYDPLPLLQPGELPAPPFTDFQLQLMQVPFRQQTIGADFATVILNTGLRGEMAWKTPDKGDPANPFVPNSDIQWVLSIDRGFGPFRIIAGYSGKYVQDFVAADPPPAFDPNMISNPEVWPMLGPMLSSQIGYYNRILFDQTHKWSHTLLVRPSLTLLHESLDLEVSGIYNFTTGEYLVYPKATYHLTDGLIATAGYQYYEGKDYTRFSWIRQSFNGPFFEVRLNF